MSETSGARVGTTVRFGEVVKLSRQNSKDPQADGFERFVGLEHLEPGDLTVRHWGDISDGTTFTNVFRPGQTLFGKRRSYQRKIAVAQFSGVCSGDIYVLEPRDDALLPELLPFICRSEPFYDYVISMSQGGLSPRVNWRALADFEFTLPPMKRQHRIAEALQASERVRSLLSDSVRRTQVLFDSMLFEIYEAGSPEIGIGGSSTDGARSGWRVEPLSNRYEVQLGKKMTPSARALDGHLPYLRNANIDWNRIDLTDVKTMGFTAKEREKYRLQPGDILACEGRHVGKSAIWAGQSDETCFQMTLHRLRRRDESEVPEFMLHYLRYYSLSGRFAAVTGETTIPHLSAEKLAALRFGFPTRDVQERVARRLRMVLNAIDQLNHRECLVSGVQGAILTSSGLA